MRAVVALALGLATAAFAAEPRFFVMGNGWLEIFNPALNERVQVQYLGPDGRYDYAAIDDLRHILHSRGDVGEGDVTPRFVELLGYLYARTGRPLKLLSGYRSPSLNDSMRRRGKLAAFGSMHTEGLAADLAFPQSELLPLWLHVRELGCCGAGYYPAQGFLHVDVGVPRYWDQTTTRVDENLSAGNARAFARTDFDRYTTGEMMMVRLYGVTSPPIRLQRSARLVSDGSGAGADVTVDEVGATAPQTGAGCIVADRTTRLLVKGAPATPRGHLVLTTCEPRAERTPERIEANPVTFR
jgi:uncharacterized protein YcbK (DUF882 family)